MKIVESLEAVHTHTHTHTHTQHCLQKCMLYLLCFQSNILENKVVLIKVTKIKNSIKLKYRDSLFNSRQNLILLCC